jgi:hypothetical protein
LTKWGHSDSILKVNWKTLSPEGRDFNADEIRASVRKFMTVLEVKEGTDPETLGRKLASQLANEFGDWLRDFSWSVDEKDREGTIERIISNVVDWHEYLVELAMKFREIETTTGYATEDKIEFAAAVLLPVVLKETYAEENWYDTYIQVLVWYLESLGKNRSEFFQTLNHIVSGRFASWVEPTEDQAREVFSEIGLGLGEIFAPPKAIDVLPLWLVEREKPVILPEKLNSFQVLRDTHKNYIETVERARP